MESGVEQMYLLEIIVEDVKVTEEGILDTLKEQAKIAELQLKRTAGKTAATNGSFRQEGPPVDRDGSSNPSTDPQITATDIPDGNLTSHSSAKQKRLRIQRTAPVKVVAQFLDLPVLEIKEVEFEKGRDEDSDAGLRSQRGKSCLFSMPINEMMDAIRKYPIKIQLHREASVDEPAHLIGKTQVCLGQEFIDSIALGNTPTIAVATVQGEYEVANIFGDATATMSLTVRLSCVGTTITTQFTYNRFEDNYKFSSGEDTKRDSVPKTPRQDGKRPIFHQDDALGIALGSQCNTPATAIPWRKNLEDTYTDDSYFRAFEEKFKSVYVDGTCGDEFNPAWTPCMAKTMKAQCPGGVCCGAQEQPRDYVPQEFGTSLPPEIKKLLPGAKKENAPPVDQWFSTWDQSLKSERKHEFEMDMGVCCGMTGQSIAQNGCSCTKMTAKVCSKATQPPPLEEAGPRLKASPGTDLFKPDIQYIPCPNSPDPPEIGGLSCGLEDLLNQQNLKNLLEPSLTAPSCPMDSYPREPSLCTCPKVPMTVSQQIVHRGVRCECSNILAALKPIELPFTCPKLPEQVEEATCSPCPPIPIRLPPPSPTCPLATLLKDSLAQATDPNTDAPKQSPDVVPQGNPTAPPYTDADESSAGTSKMSDPGAESKKTVDPKSYSSKNVPDKIKKVQKVLQEETTRSTTPYSSEPLIDRTKRSNASSNMSLTSSLVAPPKMKKKKKKLYRTVDEGRGSAYTPTRMVEPEKELNIAYTPTAGKYPGFVIGHRNCVPVVSRVPKRMGWLWNIPDANGYMKPARGWRPGCIQTNVMKVMDNIKTVRRTSTPNRSPKQSPVVLAKTKSGEQHSRKAESARQMMHKIGDAPPMAASNEPPTLHVHKKHGFHYVSMVPPPRDEKRKKSRVRRMNSRGDAMEESDSTDSPPVQFRIDTKNPDGLNCELYETDDTTTVSDDSYQMDVVVPSSLRHRQRQPVKTDMEVQVTEYDFARQPVDAKRKDNDRNGNASSKATGDQQKKGSSVSRKGKKGQRKMGNKK